MNSGTSVAVTTGANLEIERTVDPRIRLTQLLLIQLYIISIFISKQISNIYSNICSKQDSLIFFCPEN